MVFQCINIRQVPREVLKISASGLGFQYLPRDLANAWKTMFDPYNQGRQHFQICFCSIFQKGLREQKVGNADFQRTGVFSPLKNMGIFHENMTWKTIHIYVS